MMFVESCSSFYCCITYHPNLDIKQQPFYYVNGYCGSGIQKGIQSQHREHSLFLFHDVWGLSWDHLEIRGQLDDSLKSSKDSLTHMFTGWCSLLAEISAGTLARTSWAGFFVLGLPHSLVAWFQEQASQQNQAEAMNLLWPCLGSL